MLALATGGAHAQTVPSSSTPTPTATATPTTTTTPTTTSAGDFTLPEACQPEAAASTTSTTSDTTTTTATDFDSDTHGDDVSACVAALHAALGDDHGLGHFVSAVAHEERDDRRGGQGAETGDESGELAHVRSSVVCAGRVSGV